MRGIVLRFVLVVRLVVVHWHQLVCELAFHENTHLLYLSWGWLLCSKLVWHNKSLITMPVVWRRPRAVDSRVVKYPYYPVVVLISVRFFDGESWRHRRGSATSWMTGVQFPVEREFSVLHSVQTSFGIHPVDTSGSSPGVRQQGREADHPSQSNKCKVPVLN